MTITETELDKPDVGSPDDHAHYFRKEDIVKAAVFGTPIKALCGLVCIPLRDPNNFPVCPACSKIKGQVESRGMS